MPELDERGPAHGSFFWFRRPEIVIFQFSVDDSLQSHGPIGKSKYAQSALRSSQSVRLTTYDRTGPHRQRRRVTFKWVHRVSDSECSTLNVINRGVERVHTEGTHKEGLGRRERERAPCAHRV